MHDTTNNHFYELIFADRASQRISMTHFFFQRDWWRLPRGWYCVGIKKITSILFSGFVPAVQLCILNLWLNQDFDNCREINVTFMSQLSLSSHSSSWDLVDVVHHCEKFVQHCLLTVQYCKLRENIKTWFGHHAMIKTNMFSQYASSEVCISNISA